MIHAIPPSEFKEEEVQKLVDGMIERKGGLLREPLEYVASKNLVWMPYYRIELEYKRSRVDQTMKLEETARGETALNAMFCDCAESESELLMLFRPNYLKYDAVSHDPKADDAIGQVYQVDLDRVLTGLVNRRNEVEDEVYKLRSDLKKRYVRKRRLSIIFPMLGHLKEERELSEKIAGLSALRNIIGLCLNLNDDDVVSVRVQGYNTFYYPTLVSALKHRENGAERFLVVNLVKTGSIRRGLNCDVSLSRLCSKNDECRKVMKATVDNSSLSVKR